MWMSAPPFPPASEALLEIEPPFSLADGHSVGAAAAVGRPGRVPGRHRAAHTAARTGAHGLRNDRSRRRREDPRAAQAGTAGLGDHPLARSQAHRPAMPSRRPAPRVNAIRPPRDPHTRRHCCGVRSADEHRNSQRPRGPVDRRDGHGDRDTPHPYRPQTNGKVERFHRTLLEEWAYIRPWGSERERQDAYAGFLHYYNCHRTHGALGWNTPASTIKDNVPGRHS